MAVMGREPQRQQTRLISKWHDLHHVDLDLCYGLLSYFTWDIKGEEMMRQTKWIQ